MGEEDQMEDNGGGEETPPSFHEMLPEDLRGNEALKDFKDVGGLAKSFLDTQAMVGSSVRIPAEDATDEDWSKFYTKLGRPETPDAYELSEWEQPKGFKASDEMAASFKNVAHEIGLNQNQIEKLNGWYGQEINTLAEQVQGQQSQSIEQAMGVLKKEWGGAFEEKIDAANQAFLKFATEEQVAYIEETGIGNNPTLIQVWSKVAEAMGEDGVLSGDTQTGTYTPAQAKEEIAKRQKDPEFMKKYNGKDHPDHKESVSEMEKLFKLAYPE